MKELSMSMSIEQGKILINALNLLSRISIGQIREIDTFFRFRKPMEFKNQQEVEILVGQLKKAIFPELPDDGFISIAGKNASEEAQVAWEMLQSIRHTIAWDENPKGGMTVEYDIPMKLTKHNMIKCSIGETND